MTNGRQKGSVAERDVAARLQAWWESQEPGVRFIRTPLSGGWSSAQVRGEFRASGDLMTTSPNFPFVVEVKRREGFAWTNLLAGRKSPVWGWWAQARAAAKEQGGVPMLWLRRNGERWSVMLEAPIIDTLLAHRALSGRFVRSPIPRVIEGGSVLVLAAASLLAVPPQVLLSYLPAR